MEDFDGLIFCAPVCLGVALATWIRTTSRDPAL